MTDANILERARKSKLKLVSFLFCDNAGVIRGKAAHIDCLEEKLHTGMSLCTATQAATNVDELLSINGMGAAGEVRLEADPDTFAELPYAPGRGAMIADMVTVAGKPWGACPRTFLKRMERRAADLGLHVRAAFEPEWYLARSEDGHYAPIDESLDNSTIGAMFARRVIDDVVAALEDQGMRVEQYYAELGPAQQELTIGHEPPLRAADNHLLYRETVRNVAFNHGMLASFAPKPFPDQAGSGCHIHLSAWDEAQQVNLFHDRNDAYGMSALAYSFIAGVIEHLPALVALTCPSMNSYRRMEPGWWSAPFACYGHDNREAGIRVPSQFRGREMETANMELRACDSSSNPYLALGALLAAGLDGVERGLSPGPGRCVSRDPQDYSEDELRRRDIRRLPSSLRKAAQELEKDAVLLEALGPVLAGSFLAVRQAEWELFSRHDTAFETRHHFHKY